MSSVRTPRLCDYSEPLFHPDEIITAFIWNLFLAFYYIFGHNYMPMLYDMIAFAFLVICIMHDVHDAGLHNIRNR